MCFGPESCEFCGWMLFVLVSSMSMVYLCHINCYVVCFNPLSTRTHFYIHSAYHLVLYTASETCVRD
ncbi:hypothetical protein E2C01_001161 [Portunus trituberculatus]|uniref:Uncharacterized protein n=1 Tax=Portunus trituberculatus TaxID=210409 RepID=A0A5B7CLU9_PORTR|nr:hypothetical protein [Portunus trituberculatus]